MAMTYTILTGLKGTDGSIRNWCNRSTIPATTVLTEAEAFIYENLRVREMMASEAFTFLEGTNETDLPTGFLDPIEFFPYGEARALPYVNEHALEDFRDTDGNLYSGTPTRWTIFGTKAQVNVSASADYSGILRYFKTPDALALNSNETNFLTTRYPSILRAMCMAIGFKHSKDLQKYQVERAEALMMIEEANASNEQFRIGQYYPAG